MSVEGEKQGERVDGLGAYSTRSLARRCGVSVKMIEKHRRRLPGAFRVGRVWRFDKAAIERKLLTGALV